MTPTDLHDFFVLAEKLKTTYRHSVTSDNSRTESVAEHVWLASVMAMLIHPYLKVKVDLVKLLKMLLIHDLGEAVIGDIPAHIKDGANYKPLKSERDGLLMLTQPLSDELREEIMMLFDEFEARQTPTAQVAKAIDRFEALMQHNLVDIKNWDQGDYNVQPYYHDKDFNFDPYIRKLKDYVDEVSMQKIADAKALDRIDKKYIEKWKTNLSRK